MSEVDRSRREAVRMLERLGYRWSDGQWRHSEAAVSAADLTEAFIQAADALHGEIVSQCEDLAEAPETPENAETLERLAALVEAYELARPCE